MHEHTIKDPGPQATPPKTLLCTTCGKELLVERFFDPDDFILKCRLKEVVDD